MNITKSELDKRNKAFEEGIDRAIEHIKLIHISSLISLPDDDDLRKRMYDATDAGTLVITENGDVQFTKGIKE